MSFFTGHARGTTGKSTLGYLRYDPFPTVIRPLRNPLSGFRSPSEFHQRHTVGLTPDASQGCRRSLPTPPEVFVPFSVLGTAGSHLTPVGSQPTGYVAPSGFGALSTPCSPHSLPSLFHPGSAHGVFALRGFAPLDDAVRPLERRLPLGVGHIRCWPPLQGLTHRQESRLESWSLAKLLRRMPPWALSPSRPLAAGGVQVSQGKSGHPLSRFAGWVAC